MNKKFLSIAIIVILICVCLSGCNESDDEKDNSKSSITVIFEAIAQVVNSTGDPLGGVSVRFDLGHEDLSTKVVDHITDSTGWTGFAVESISIKEGESAFCVVSLLDNDAVYEKHRVLYSEVESKTVDGSYYNSISARLVQE